jgi:hypothetical protein
MVSEDYGSTWSTEDLTASSLWTTIAYGNGIIIAAAYSRYIINYSQDDGLSWTSYDMELDLLGINPLWISSSYDSTNNKFILTSNSSSNIAIISFSGTGAGLTISVVASYLPATSNWKCLAHGNNLLIAVGENSFNYATSSNGGVSWTQRTLPSSKKWAVLEYINSKFMLIDDTFGETNAVLLTSSNGINWSSTTLPVGSYRSISYGNNTYLLTSSGSSVLISANGTTWSSSIIPVNYPNSIIGIYKNNFIIVGENISQNLTSPNGTVWTIRSGYNHKWFDMS